MGLDDSARMSWNNVPIEDEQDIQDFQWRMQFWRAVRERVRAAGIGAGNSLSSAHEPVIIELDGADVIPPATPQVGERWLVLPAAANQPDPRYIYMEEEPPTSPVSNSLYGVLGSNGAWAGHANQLAVWRPGPQEWRFYQSPNRRMYCNRSTNSYYVYNNGELGLVGTALWKNNPNTIATWTGTVWSFEALNGNHDRLRLYKVGESYYHTHGSTSNPIIRPLRATGDNSDPFGPIFGLTILASLPGFYTRPDISDYTGISDSPDYYHHTDFWADVGVPENVRPNEDIFTPNDPPTGFLKYQAFEGARYLVRRDTGAWSGHRNEIATAHFDPPTYPNGPPVNLTWTFETPADGYMVASRITNGTTKYYKYDAATTEWSQISEGVGWYTPYYRTITSLAADGEVGQRARLRLKSQNTSGGAALRWRDLRTDPPAADPIGNSLYGVLPNATGAWEGHDGEIARWDNSGRWFFLTPDPEVAYAFGIVQQNGKVTVYHHKYSKVYFSHNGQWHRWGPGYEYYQHDGNNWVLAEDQASPADVVEHWSVAPSQKDYDYVIGKHLWDQIYEGCRLLHRRATPRTENGYIRSVATVKKSVDVESKISFDDAKAKALAAWNAAEWDSRPEFSGFRVTAYNQIYETAYLGPRWIARLNRTRSKFRALFSAPSAAARQVTVSFYVIADEGPHFTEFSNQGDNVAQLSARLVEQQIDCEKAASYETSSLFGSEDAPANPWHYDDYGGWVAQRQRDWITNDFQGEVFAIEEWNVEGGFEYQ